MDRKSVQSNERFNRKENELPIKKPYKRTARPFLEGGYSGNGGWSYIRDKNYAQSPEQYTRAFLLLQKDLFTLFDYIEPADKNLQTYSYRIHELLLRACIEIEANSAAILTENGYQKAGNWTMDDYKKINQSHRLSSFEVKLPIWNGVNSIRKPFINWANNGSLEWYQAYNKAKHNRHAQFELATFESLIDAVCGLVIILSAQFWTDSFSPGTDCLALESGPGNGMEYGIGDYFQIKFPLDWPEEEKYDFKWQEIAQGSIPFQNYIY